MNKIFVFTLFIIILASLSLAQQSTYIKLGGSVNYVPMRAFTKHILMGNQEAEFDFLTPGYSLELGFGISKNSGLSLSGETFVLNSSFGHNEFSWDWEFRTYIVSIGYDYYFMPKESAFTPYIGIGPSFYYLDTNSFENTESEAEIIGDTHSSDKSWGIYMKCGTDIKLSESFFLCTELKYTNMPDLDIGSRWRKLNLSGLAINISLKLLLF